MWRGAMQLAQELPTTNWTLVGGLMVQLHAYRRGQANVRPTEDIDVLGDSRSRPVSITEVIAEKLIELGFKADDPGCASAGLSPQEDGPEQVGAPEVRLFAVELDPHDLRAPQRLGSAADADGLAVCQRLCGCFRPSGPRTSTICRSRRRRHTMPRVVRPFRTRTAVTSLDRSRPRARPSSWRISAAWIWFLGYSLDTPETGNSRRLVARPALRGARYSPGCRRWWATW